MCTTYTLSNYLENPIYQGTYGGLCMLIKGLKGNSVMQCLRVSRGGLWLSFRAIETPILTMA